MDFAKLFGKKKSTPWDAIMNVVQQGVGAFMHRTENKVMSTIQMIEERVISKIDAVKRHIMRSLLELMFYMVSVVSIIIGVILLLGKYISYEWIFLGVGVLTLWAGIIMGSVKN